MKVAEDGLGFSTVARLAWAVAVGREKKLGLIRDIYFGLCTGMANGNRGSGMEPLTGRCPDTGTAQWRSGCSRARAA